MAAKFLFAVAALALVQIAFGQIAPLSYLAPGSYGNSGSYYSGNAVTDNDVTITTYGLSPAELNSLVSSISGTASTGSATASGGIGVSLGSAAPFGSLGSLSGGSLGSFGSSFGSLGLAAPASISVAAPVGLGSGLVAGLPGLSLAAISPLSVTTISPFGPSGLALAAELELAGVLDVVGQAPFLSAVAFQGALPTAGSGVASCGCGDGQVGIIGPGPGSFPLLSGFGPVYY